MRYYIPYIWLTLWTTETVCNKLASPYQAMLIWYAYQMEIKAFPSYAPKDRFIAPGCKGSRPDGSCYFDDLLQYIQDTESDSPWKGTTTIGKNLTPELATIVKDLSAQGYNQVTDGKKMLPLDFPSSASKPGFYGIFTKLVNAIQQCRTEAGDTALSSELASVRDAMKQVHYARLQDQAAVSIAEVNDILMRRGITWTVSTKTLSKPPIPDYQVIDTQETLKLHGSNLAPDLRASIKDWTTNFAKTEEYRNHAAVIRTCQTLVGRVNKIKPDC